MGIFTNGNDKKDNQKETPNPSMENESTTSGLNDQETASSNSDNASGTDEIKAMLEQKSKQCDEYFNMLQRTAAEFDNYKKRTAKEKEALYWDAVGETVLAMLPVVDNFERAIKAAENDPATNSSFKEGMELVYRQLKDALKDLGVEEIKSIGENFDPQLHNAVMHIEDDSYGDSTIVEEFQKGYVLKDKIIRHSMVKVAN
ncbi:MAG TPA: nucleotide exchange factor GrpE [Pseudobacteroides sp.]|uniref:nucleotide exchange factor GrpE n=1 Tax=Pseudobacteroides sp. TaxID=1968840 RepID=UPI002F923228